MSGAPGFCSGRFSCGVMYGWLVCFDRTAWGMVDMFCTFIRRLSCFFLGVLVAFFAVVMHPSLVFASGSQTTSAQALSSCQAYAASVPNQDSGAITFTVTINCVPAFDAANNQDAYEEQDKKCNTSTNSCTNDAIHYYDYGGVVTNPCSSLTSSTTTISIKPGSGALGSGGATTVLDPSSGAYVQCPYNISYNTTQCVVTSTGYCYVQATITYTGNPLSTLENPSPPTTPGTPEYNNGSGQLANPQPTTGPTAPTVCGGGSCYDPNSLQFCGVSGSGQFCVPLSSADTTYGACTSSSGSTLCAGSPTPPSPVGTSGSTITNPPTQIGSSDTYPVEPVSGGSPSTVTVNTYNGPGATTSSGSTSTSQKTGGSAASSSAPASSSSSGSSDSYGGGTDCNTPPVCSGDAVLCGIGRQQYIAMCVQQNYMVGNGQQPPTFQSDQSKYSQSNVWVQPSTGNTQGDQANQGTYNQSGFGYSRSCPLTDMRLSSVAVTIPFSNGCAVLSYVGSIILAFALYGAAKITAGSVME